MMILTWKRLASAHISRLTDVTLNCRKCPWCTAGEHGGGGKESRSTYNVTDHDQPHCGDQLVLPELQTPSHDLTHSFRLCYQIIKLEVFVASRKHFQESSSS